MTRVMTGPYGRLAYFNAQSHKERAYPVLNTPSNAFARGEGLVAANGPCAPIVAGLSCRMRPDFVLAVVGAPAMGQR